MGIQQILKTQAGKVNKTLVVAAAITGLTIIPGKLIAAEFAGKLKSVSITDAAGANTPPVTSFNYTKDGNTVSFDASGSSDPDGSIAKYQWDFGDGNSAVGATATHQYQAENNYQVTLTVVDNIGAATLYQEALSLISKFSAAISFQPENAAAPSGFIDDSGKAFSPDTGFGWSVLPTGTKLFDYDHPMSPDQEYDTVMVMDTPDGVWEQNVPNGDYTVTVCMGDPKYPVGGMHAQAEGVYVVKGVLSEATPWIEETADVTVSDGKLTLTFNGGGSKRRLAWLRINQK